ncbi:hypothetical protein JYU34_013731 [Plutella xylostella]|uniref:Uncharacterized protein n=1 Tax=Plutella xylostella TaxID=51655 RepID=A0ABQ7QE54_PLUXY|nr:hypothetical protein JYU34_013731 [Plutella xylostella]
MYRRPPYNPISGSETAASAGTRQQIPIPLGVALSRRNLQMTANTNLLKFFRGALPPPRSQPEALELSICTRAYGCDCWNVYSQILGGEPKVLLPEHGRVKCSEYTHLEIISVRRKPVREEKSRIITAANRINDGRHTKENKVLRPKNCYRKNIIRQVKHMSKL